MKPANLYINDRVPWNFALFFSFIITILSISPGAYSQMGISENAYSISGPVPNFLMLNEVNRHAAKHFMDHFLPDGGEKWFRDNDQYVATFTQGGIRNKAYYKANGDFELVEKCYGDEFLDRDLKNAIHQRFRGYNITSVIEITDLEKDVYIVKIANSENILTITCSDGKLEVTAKILNGGI
jgi:hypothetical protein